MSTTQSQKIEGPCHSELERSSNCTRGRVPQPSHDSRRHLRTHYSKIHNRQLDWSRSERPRAGTKSLSQNPMSSSANTICSTMPPRENMVSRTNYTTNQLQVQQLINVFSWFIWHGATFKLPVSTLQRPKDQGGWAMANIDVKCRTLLYARLWLLCAPKGSITTKLMRK